jgi:hypothetical protein
VLNSNKNQLQGAFPLRDVIRYPSVPETRKRRKILSHFPVSPPKETKDNNNKISYTWALRPMDGRRSKG